MKKFLLTFILLVCVMGVSTFAWEPMDLTTYPSFTKPGDWILNLGMGFSGIPGQGRNYGKDYIFIPPVHLSLDRNVPLGDKGLPFFFGGFLDHWGYGSKIKDQKYYYSSIGLGVRFGYHFNWGVDKLDTYAVTQAGWSIWAGKKDYLPTKFGWPSLSINIGARYFLIDWFGFWAEAGMGSLFSVNLGLAFKF